MTDRTPPTNFVLFKVERERAARQCPDCRHPWGSHRGRAGGQRCWYQKFNQHCNCRRINPDVEAEDRLAGALWRMTTGGLR